jgi:hypothetical protein
MDCPDEEMRALMVVVDMREYRSRENVAVLAYLLERARVGDLDGVALSARFADGREQIAFTGSYRKNPERSLATFVRIVLRFAGLIEDDQEDRETRF